MRNLIVAARCDTSKLQCAFSTQAFNSQMRARSKHCKQNNTYRSTAAMISAFRTLRRQISHVISRSQLPNATICKYLDTWKVREWERNSKPSEELSGVEYLRWSETHGGIMQSLRLSACIAGRAHTENSIFERTHTAHIWIFPSDDSRRGRRRRRWIYVVGGTYSSAKFTFS